MKIDPNQDYTAIAALITFLVLLGIVSGFHVARTLATYGYRKLRRKL